MPATVTAILTLAPAVSVTELFVGCIATLGKPITVKVNGCVVVSDNASVTLTVKLKIPLFVGVPEIKPLVAKDRPDGKEPENIDQL
jgi:hypothetical protein